MIKQNINILHDSKLEDFFFKADYYADQSIPFLFICDFEIEKPIIVPISKIDREEILVSMPSFDNSDRSAVNTAAKIDIINRVSYDEYLKAFNIIQEEIKRGNTYLINLTFPTEIKSSSTLKEIFYAAGAKYRLYLKNKFTLFSPETFVTITDNIISAFPMKGTISAGIPDAAKILLADEKEFAEHITVTDLLRNDLGIVSERIELPRFRYIEKIKTGDGDILQTSSEIRGTISKEFVNKPGSVLRNILPAGSVSGAPKKKTLEIISKAENGERGYYCGVFGTWIDGNLDSAVMIRFIENINGKLFYRSGGGITIYSDPEKEYREIFEKIYVPVY